MLSGQISSFMSANRMTILPDSIRSPSGQSNNHCGIIFANIPSSHPNLLPMTYESNLSQQSPLTPQSTGQNIISADCNFQQSPLCNYITLDLNSATQFPGGDTVFLRESGSSGPSRPIILLAAPSSLDSEALNSQSQASTGPLLLSPLCKQEEAEPVPLLLVKQDFPGESTVTVEPPPQLSSPATQQQQQQFPLIRIPALCDSVYSPGSAVSSCPTTTISSTTTTSTTHQTRRVQGAKRQASTTRRCNVQKRGRSVSQLSTGAVESTGRIAEPESSLSDQEEADLRSVIGGRQERSGQPEGADRLSRKRERNRDAARRCRDRKNQRLVELTVEVQEKQRTIDLFQGIIREVQQANEVMRRALLHHQAAGCRLDEAGVAGDDEVGLVSAELRVRLADAVRQAGGMTTKAAAQLPSDEEGDNDQEEEEEEEEEEEQLDEEDEEQVCHQMKEEQREPPRCPGRIELPPIRSLAGFSLNAARRS